MKPGNKTRLNTKSQEIVITPKEVVLPKSEIDDHINNKGIHTTEVEKNQLDRLYDNIDHPINEDIHVTKQDKEKWDTKETPASAQAKVDVIKVSLTKHEKDLVSHTTQKEKDLFKDKYSRVETDNKLKTILYGQNWLKEVSIMQDLYKRYPNPKIGDTCTVTSIKCSYTFNGVEWVLNNTQYIPLATKDIDGLLHSIDKVKLDSIQQDSNNYQHPNDIDTRHVSDAEKLLWNNKADNKIATILSDGLISKLDKVKLDSIEKNANNYTHPDKHDPIDINQSDEYQFVSLSDKVSWNSKETTTGSQEKANIAIQEANRYTNNKISGFLRTSTDTLEVLNDLAYKLQDSDVVTNLISLIEEKVSNTVFETHTSNKNVHLTLNDKQILKSVDELLKNKPIPDWDETNPSSTSFIKNKPDSFKADGGNSDTVGGYNINDLMKNKKANTLTIGTTLALHTLDDVDILCDGKDDQIKIMEGISKLVFGGTVLFREGEYNISSSIDLKISDIKLEGTGNSTIFIRQFDDKEPLLKITGNNNIVNDIFITNYSKVKGLGLMVSGNENVIKKVTVSTGGGIYIIDGSLNLLENNTIKNSNKNAIYINTDMNTSYGNIVRSNHIIGGNIGVAINSNAKSNHSNIVDSNIIINCNIGILLSNDINKPYTKFNNISNNTVTRGSGTKNDYTDSQSTIKVDNGTNNNIHDNIVSGKDVQVLGSNISHDNIF